MNDGGTPFSRHPSGRVGRALPRPLVSPRRGERSGAWASVAADPWTQREEEGGQGKRGTAQATTWTDTAHLSLRYDMP